MHEYNMTSKNSELHTYIIPDLASSIYPVHQLTDVTWLPQLPDRYFNKSLKYIKSDKILEC